MMISLKLLPLFVVAAIAAFAVLHPLFKDSLLQRIGLSGICVGSCAKIVTIVQSGSSTDEAGMLLVYGLAFYSVGTAIKLWRLYKNDPNPHGVE